MPVSGALEQGSGKAPVSGAEISVHDTENGHPSEDVYILAIEREGAAHFDVAWDYFSEKDGEVHHFDLCEECYDGVTREFLIEADKEERTELL